MAKNEPYRAVLYKFVKNHEGMAKKDVIEANSNLPVHQSTLYRWYDLIQQTNSISRKIAPGPTIEIATKSTIQSIKKSSIIDVVDLNQPWLAHSTAILHMWGKY